MKRKFISAVLVVAMAVGMLAGCGDTDIENNNTEVSETETLGDTQAQLSSPDYDFEKEYIFGDFNAFSNSDIDRQGGIDTFEDKEVVYQDITYDQLIYLVQQEGNYLIQLTGSWCHNSRAMAPYVTAYAKEYGIDTIYTYDFNLSNSLDGATFARMTNGASNIGVNYNYMYGELVTKYLTNLNDWVAYPSDSAPAISYTNAAGKEVTIARLQQPFLFLYNKDNTVDNSGSGNGSTSCPIVYAFEQMVDRDSEGVYVTETDEEGNTTRVYVTDEYKENLRKIFDYIADNNVQISHYTKEQYMKDAFNHYGTEIFAEGDSVNVYPVTYRQLVWLLQQDGNSLVLFGGPEDEATRAIISRVNASAVKNNLRVYMYNPEVDGGITTDVWGYKKSTTICAEDSLLLDMYMDLVEKSLTNLQASASLEDGTALIKTPYLFAYNKDAKDTDGFIMPITAYSEFTYTIDPETRYYIGKEDNQTACDEKIMAVLTSYAANAGITVE